ncbi:MAG: GspE/PulE family protein [Bacillota bacterium]|nr:GspE/PulE family protein [Bacillota bacterium]
MYAREGQKRKPLGDLLVELGRITRAELEKALDYQRKRKIRLGQALVELRYLSEPELVQVLKTQLGLPSVNLAQEEPSGEALALVPEHLVRRHAILPLRRQGERLLVAAADPFNVVALDEVEALTGLKVELVLAGESELQEALNRYYGSQQAVEAVIRTLQEREPLPEDEFTAERLLQMGNEAPIVQLVNLILERAVRERASDIHLEPMKEEVRVRYRIDGFLREIMRSPLKTHPALVSRIKVLARMDIAERRLPQDGQILRAIDGEEVEFRVSTVPGYYGEKVVLRILRRQRELLHLSSLGFSAENLRRYRKSLSWPHGMILLTGPTGSGKTTTLYATLNELNTPERNIITIEDPVEYTLQGITQIGVNYKAGLTFDRILKFILRQDPDVVMVGEIRDKETARLAVQAALTGHLVLSTLHTNDAAGALTRLIDMGIEPFLIASAVNCVLAQRLVRTVCSECRREEPLTREMREALGQRNGGGVSTFQRGAGCLRCGYSGYYGRTGLFEVMPLTPRLRELIARRADADALKKAAIAEGMATLQEDGWAKVGAGLTTPMEVLRVVAGDE